MIRVAGEARGPGPREGAPRRKRSFEMGTFAIVGSGAWGTALASHAARIGHAVRVWALEPEVVEEINSSHTNCVYLPDAPLPESIRASSDPAKVVSGAEVILLVPPSKHLRAVSSLVAEAVSPEALVVVCSKGIEEDSLKLMSEVLAETMPDLSDERLAFLSGPSFAREVARGLPTDVALASRGMVAAKAVQPMLHAPMFRVYTSRDPIGVQIGGAVKNVAAVATGASDGLGFGANARAALITRALAEITRLGVALGADPLTFLGMAGVGDLVLTCTGDLSRNRTLGKEVAKGANPRTYLESLRSVAEGFFTSAAAYDLSRKVGVDMPITEQVFHVLHRDRPLLEAVRMLTTREFKEELNGIRQE
jgi:glycerol-3-phosphate dehydrogenase (NAD(P)+)